MKKRTTHERRHCHHRRREPDRRPGTAVHPVGRGRGIVHGRVHTAQFDRASNDWKDGETLFLRCSTWRQAAENVSESLTRGMRVVAQGRLKQRSYETSEGGKRTVVELDVDEIGPSLRYATAKVNRSQRPSDEAPADDPWAQEPIRASTG